MLKMPIAMMALIAPGPKMAVIMMAESRAGKAKTMSFNRMIASSSQPPRAAAQQPSGTPAPMPMPTATSATAIELREPARTIVFAYLFAFTIGCFANSLLLNFTEGNLFIFLIGIFLSCRRGTPSQTEERLGR